jgi:hypothetical protein
VPEASAREADDSQALAEGWCYVGEAVPDNGRRPRWTPSLG